MTSYNLAKCYQCLDGTEGLKPQDANIKDTNSLCFRI
jgi:hypothetical protein